MSLASQLYIGYGIKSVDWDRVRYIHARVEELKELEKKKKTHKNRSVAALEAWGKRLNK